MHVLVDTPAKDFLSDGAITDGELTDSLAISKTEVCDAIRRSQLGFWRGIDQSDKIKAMEKGVAHGFHPTSVARASLMKKWRTP